MLDFGLNIFFEQMDALQERVEELERLVSASLQERHAAEAALQRAETAYAGLQAENERTGHVLVQVREELQRREEARGLLEKQITTLKEEIERLKKELQSKTQDSGNLPPSPQKEIAKEPSAGNEESEKKPPSPRKKRKEKTPKASTSVATQLFFSFDD